MLSTRRRPERVMLVGVQAKGSTGLWTAEESLEELGDLARSANASVVGSLVQRLDKPSHLYLGKGKLNELAQRTVDQRVDTVVCDDELTPAQQRNLEKALTDVKVIDRTALILDVFAQRASTREGRLQVELAQNEYNLPRLAGLWTHLERLGGGIGTRGPGETQLESDRRMVRSRIQRLKRDLEEVRKHRGRYRSRRRERQVPVASLVGYTNAGKSTLLNKLTGAGVVAEDRLFSTLDPVTRKVVLPSGRELLVTDTVGFIQKLPPTVVAAFRATLEEAQESALVIHVVDITHSNAGGQAEVVDKILEDLGLAEKPRLLVLNKSDLLEPADGPGESGHLQELAGEHRRVVFTSALSGTGLNRLRAEMDELLESVMPYAATVEA